VPKNTEDFIKGLCTPLVVDMDRVAMIEAMPDPEKLQLHFLNGFSVIVEPVAKPDISKAADVQRIVDRWSGRGRSPFMVECWSDTEGPTDGYGHAWVDLSGCVTFSTKFANVIGRVMRTMTVRFAEGNGESFVFFLHPDDGMSLSEDEQNERLTTSWRRARGEKV
jgi:hypothetical protein